MFLKKYLVIFGLAAFGISGVAVMPSPRSPLSFPDNNVISPEPAPALRKRSRNPTESEKAYLLEDYVIRPLSTPILKERNANEPAPAFSNHAISSISTTLDHEPTPTLRMRRVKTSRLRGLTKNPGHSPESAPSPEERWKFHHL